MTYRILFLDDSDERQEAINYSCKCLDVELVSSYNLSEFQHSLNKKFDIIFLDHDLGEEVGTKAVDLLFDADYNRDVLVVIHSHNYEGSLNIKSKLNSAGFNKIMLNMFSADVNWLDDCIWEVDKKKYDKSISIKNS